MNTPITYASMVVAERGSDWAGWVERFREECPSVVLVVQQPGESLAELSVRVRDRAEEIEAGDPQVSTAVIVGGGRTDADALAARSLSIRAIASLMARSGGGRLLLDAKAEDRYSMMALASTVSDMVGGTGVRISPVNALKRVA